MRMVRVSCFEEAYLWTLSGKIEFYEERHGMILLRLNCTERGRGVGAGMRCTL